MNPEHDNIFPPDMEDFGHDAEEFRSGFVAILGRPNAGKSTLLNRLVGEKLAAVSPLPQTTRVRLNGIYTDDRAQIILVDLPGVCEPSDKLNECLLVNIEEALKDVDAVLHLVDVGDQKPISEEVAGSLSRVKTPIVLAVNKLDGPNKTVDSLEWARSREEPFDSEIYEAVLGISALNGEGLDAMIEALIPLLPPGPPLYDPETLTDQTMRDLSAEMIREKAFYFLHQELPYSTAVTIEEFKEREEGKWYIHATIHVERDSQKGMVIGKRGAMLKRISTAARKDIERLTGMPVYLELWVKVRHKWRKKEHYLREFGFKPPKKK